MNPQETDFIDRRNKHNLPFYHQLLDLIEAKAEDLVVDIGSGTSPLLGEDLGIKIIDLSIIPEELKSNTKNHFPVAVNALKLPFADNSVSGLVACNFPEIDTTVDFKCAVVDEMARVLKQGHKLAFIVDTFIASNGRSSDMIKRFLDRGLEVIVYPSGIVVVYKPLELTQLNDLPIELDEEEF